jgi:hypothetical protein
MIFYIVFNLNPLPMSFNIDIHCHSSSKPFMSRIGQQKHTPFETYNFEITHPIYQMLRKPLQQFSKSGLPPSLILIICIKGVYASP